LIAIIGAISNEVGVGLDGIITVLNLAIICSNFKGC